MTLSETNGRKNQTKSRRFFIINGLYPLQSFAAILRYDYRRTERAARVMTKLSNSFLYVLLTVELVSELRLYVINCINAFSWSRESRKPGGDNDDDDDEDDTHALLRRREIMENVKGVLILNRMKSL